MLISSFEQSYAGANRKAEIKRDEDGGNYKVFMYENNNLIKIENSPNIFYAEQVAENFIEELRSLNQTNRQLLIG